jgi:phage gp45-like
MRSTMVDAARRAYNTLTRATLKSASDDHLMQQVDVNMHEGEAKKGVERFQHYGFSAVPHKQKNEKDKKIAEALIGYIGGNPGHAVILAIDDRRHRLKNQKDGEVALYDDQGQVLRITRDGIVISSHKAVTHEVAPVSKQRGEKDYGQDANAARDMKTRIIQGTDHIQIQVGDNTLIRLDEKGIKSQTDGDKSITSQTESGDITSTTKGGMIEAKGPSIGWNPPA